VHLVKLQQNLNHCALTALPVVFYTQHNTCLAGYAPKVGSIDVSISVEGRDFASLASFDDFRTHDMVTVTNFTLPIKVPATVTDNAVLRVRYISNNPLEIDPANNTAAVFYNCADIKITDAEEDVSPTPSDALVSTPTVKAAALEKLATSAPAFSCQPPPLFHAYGETVSRAGNVVHEIWYDGAQQVVRWDRRGAIVNGTMDYISTITNYSDVRSFGIPEFVIHPEQNKCDVYGGDAFYSWSFGGSDQPFLRNFSVAGRTVHEFYNPDSGITWQAVEVASESGATFCLPFSTEMAHSDSLTVFQAETVNAFEPSIFVPPSFCKSPSAENIIRCSGKHGHKHL
jgi:hypothetical protein